MTRIVVADDYQNPFLFGGEDDPHLTRLREIGEVTVHHTPPADRSEFLARIASADALVIVLLRSQLDEEALSAAPRLRLISFAGSGANNIDQVAAPRLGITVCNVPGANSHSVAEFALGLMFAVMRTIPLYDHWMREGRWERVVGRELTGKTLGLLGVGAIGSHLAALAQGVGMRVIGTSHRQEPERLRGLGIEPVARDALFREADVVSIHLRGIPETQGAVGAAELALMKSSAVLINTARGSLVDDQALVAALRERTIAGAGLDVFHLDPLPLAENLYRDLDNVVLTPHSGSETAEANERVRSNAVENVVAFYSGTPRNVLAGPALAKPV